MVLKGLIEYCLGRIQHDRLYRPPPDRGFIAYIKRKTRPSLRKFVFEERMGLFLNRYCNLKCYSCAALGMNPPSDETTLEEIKAYLKNIEGYKPGATFMLTGGRAHSTRSCEAGGNM